VLRLTQATSQVAVAERMAREGIDEATVAKEGCRAAKEEAQRSAEVHK
jgi:hypothetical protein